MTLPVYRTSAAGGSSNGTGDRSAAITPAVGDLFIVFCHSGNNSNTSPTCSDDNSGSYSLITAGTNTGTTQTFSAFVRTSTLANTTSTTVTVAAGSNDSGELVIVAISNMHRTGLSAIRSSGSSYNNSTGTPTATLSQNALTTNVTIAAAGTILSSQFTPPTNWTERQEAAQASPGCSVEVATRDSGFTSAAITWGNNPGLAWDAIVLELDASYLLSVTTGAFTLTGNAVTFTYTQNRTLAVTTGAFTLTGTTTNLTRALRMTTTTGAFTLTGVAVTLWHGKTLSVTTGAFTLTGNNVGWKTSRVAATGAFTLTGVSINLLAGNHILQTSTGVFTLNASDLRLLGPSHQGSIDLGLGVSIT